MADILLLSHTTGQGSNVAMDVVESIEQMTLVAGGAIKAGAPVHINTSGQFVEGSGSNTTRIYGIATHNASTGQPVTAIKRGVVGGYNFSAVAFWADLFASNTSGTVADAAGTNSKILGQVIPIRGTVPGSGYNKAMLVNL